MSSLICMMSPVVATEILCITNIGSISLKYIAVVGKNAIKCQIEIVLFFIAILHKYLK